MAEGQAWKYAVAESEQREREEQERADRGRGGSFSRRSVDQGNVV